MRADPCGVGWIHDGLASGSDGNWFGKGGLTSFGHPCNLKWFVMN